MGVDVGGTSSAKSEPNIVPLCDILLVLLIIFMVITPVAQKGIDIKLPESADPTEMVDQSSGIVLTLERSGALKINQESITVDMLENRLRDLFQARSNKTIFIRADSKTTYKKVLEIIDLAKGAGIDVLGVVTDRYESSE